MEIKSYATPKAFMIALNDRLKAHASKARRAPWRMQQLVIFERFLARVVVEFADAMVLKGGLALELRLARARTTKDVDTRFAGNPDSLLPRLQQAGRLDLHDFMTFEVEVDKNHSEIEAEEAKYGGKRFRVTCKIAGQKYGAPFGLDVGVGDPMIRMPEETTMPDRLGFIGVAPPRLRIYPIETHIAEKLHAYTKPRDRPNSRDKDLPDLALISTMAIPSATSLREALEQTFGFRGTHVVPTDLPHPPEFWHALYRQKLEDYGLEWSTLEACHERASRFLNPVLAGIQESAWDPASGEWRGPQGSAARQRDAVPMVAAATVTPQRRVQQR
jgi:predicted nucleotidyltransferase component of viral defense system